MTEKDIRDRTTLNELGATLVWLPILLMASV